MANALTAGATVQMKAEKERKELELEILASNLHRKILEQDALIRQLQKRDATCPNRRSPFDLGAGVEFLHWCSVCNQFETDGEKCPMA